MIILVIYAVIGYWATGRTIYRNRILIGNGHSIGLMRFTLGLALGPILIPWALINVLLGR